MRFGSGHAILFTAAFAAAWAAACSTPETARDTATDVSRVASPDGMSEDVSEPISEADVLSRAALTPGATLPPILRTPGPDEPPPDLDDIGRWFEGPPLSGALALWKSGERVPASRALEAFAAAHPEDPRALPARFMSAWMLVDGEPDPTVARRFSELAADWPLMADACHYHAALAHLTEVELDEARAVALAIPEDSVFWGPAQTVLARVFMDEGKTAQARALLEEAARKKPAVLPPEAWALLESERMAANDELNAARARYELATRFAGHDLGRQAYARIVPSSLAGGDRLRLARALLDAGRVDATRAVLAGLRKPKDEACQAWILLGRAWERKKKDPNAQANAWKWYKKALECTGEVRGDATFLGGRNRMRNDDAKTGLPLLKAHVDEFPERSTADDCLHMIADAKKRPRDIDKGLVKALTLYPAGDQADEIAWDLVQKPLEKRRWKEVSAAIDKVFRATDNRPWSRHGGRYHYWKARALWELGKKDEARRMWRELVRRHPLTWYATLALSRLASEDESLPLRLMKDSEPTSAAGEATNVERPNDGTPSRALWADDHFRRAIEWARLAGPFEAAESGHAAFHRFIDLELSAVADKVRGPDWLWTEVAVRALAGDYPRAMRLARLEEQERPLPWPTAETSAARVWQLAYPKAYDGLVTTWTATRNLEPAWIWAIARVESNFDPGAISFANAIGLMQIIPSTAAFLARDTTIDPTREALQRPAVALELGTKYLARLLAKHEVYPLASAGYNAGGGAVSRWRREFGDLELDEFVERIPYREANNYAKSVTQTMARYLWLYEGRVLTLPMGPPGLPKDPSPTEGVLVEPATEPLAPDDADSSSPVTPASEEAPSPDPAAEPEPLSVPK